MKTSAVSLSCICNSEQWRKLVYHCKLQDG
jgi:hypothetical protein